MRNSCIAVVVLFLAGFANNGFAVKGKCRYLPGNTNIEKNIVETLGAGQHVSKESIDGLMKERKDAFLKYVDEIILPNDDENLFNVAGINLKDVLISAIRNVDISIENADFILLNTKYGKNYEVNLVKSISQIGQNLVSALFRSRSYSFLIDNVLSADNLYGVNFDTSFAFIRRMADLQQYDRYLGLPKSSIDSTLGRIFPCSKRLMKAVCFDELVRKKFYQSLSKKDFLDKCKVTEDDSSFRIDVENLSVVFKPKGAGVNPGYILDIGNGDKFFIKMFHLASYKRRKDSKSQVQDSGTRTYVSNSVSIQASLRSSIDTEKTIDAFKLNLREPFLYTVLDLFGIGAEFTFVINPYIYQGVYIVTKDVSVSECAFVTFKEIENKIRNRIFTVEAIKQHNVELAVNELDFVGKLFGLKDLHCENFGFLFDKNESPLKDSLRIVDFVYPDFTFDGDNFISNFIMRKSDGLNIDEGTLLGELIRYCDGSTALKEVFSSLNSRIDNAYRKIPTDFEEVSSVEKFNKIMSFSLKKINDELMKVRGNSEDERMLSFDGHPRTNAELIGFSKGQDTRSYDIAYDDLRNYVSTLTQNYEKFVSHVGSLSK